MIMKAISITPRSGQRGTGRSAVVLLHGHQLERSLARAVTAEAVGTFVLVLAITSTAAAATLSRPIAGAPYGSLAVPVAGFIHELPAGEPVQRRRRFRLRPRAGAHQTRARSTGTSSEAEAFGP
jgi:hypothetical protein